MKRVPRLNEHVYDQHWNSGAQCDAEQSINARPMNAEDQICSAVGKGPHRHRPMPPARTNYDKGRMLGESNDIPGCEYAHKSERGRRRCWIFVYPKPKEQAAIQIQQ